MLLWTLMYIFVWIYVFSSVGGVIAGLCSDSMFNFLRNCQTILTKWLHWFRASPKMSEGSCFPTSSPVVVYCPTFSFPPCWWVWSGPSLWVWLHFPSNLRCWDFSVCLSTIQLSSWRNVCLNPLLVFRLHGWCICCSLVFFIYSGYQFLNRCVSCRYCLPFCALSSHILGVFLNTKVSILIKYSMCSFGVFFVLFFWYHMQETTVSFKVMKIYSDVFF